MTLSGQTDIKLNYYEAGNPQKPTVVLLHGGAMLHCMWLPQLAPLSERYHVLAPDLLYDDLKQPTIAQLADDIGELIRQRSAAAAHVVGLSLGGIVATQLAISAPDNVRSWVQRLKKISVKWAKPVSWPGCGQWHRSIL